MTTTMCEIEHTVTFRLIHDLGSPKEAEFLKAASELAAIPGVQHFRIRRQTNSKNPHTYGIAMQFQTNGEYLAYCQHPAHVNFVQQRWLSEVADFQEADFERLTTDSE
ncbi:Stress responsive A/B Barrel Domain protein [Rubripirellula lacrimiformis]|uniref:Stress responsive A/B Barrel Domain protein n=1 Tax=Rubripirellula lacrimiformis TaxID=1930273 RepID=A0A517NEG4_9BACT|nr:Dabb family protein [Rubripirellula lacrimiformis]QDT05510.1 Stress responsive A/B Barrel Domain protein [Rubripirellula lacrimiformis]